MKTLDAALNYYKTTLGNGLRIIIVEMPHLHSLEISMYVKVGSRFETIHNNGISHFLEHMLFRGTKNMPDSYHLHKSFESLGGDINALTTSEYTCFWLTSHPRYFAEGIGLFSEMFTSPTFADIETEKKIVLEEILNEQNEKGENIEIDIPCPCGNESMLSIPCKDEVSYQITQAEPSEFDEYFTPEYFGE